MSSAAPASAIATPGADPNTRGISPAYPIGYEPRLVEDAVLAMLRGRAEERVFRTERDALYTIADPDEREARFSAVHTAWFERLGLAGPVPEALGEQPTVASGTARCLVIRAASSREEGAELFVAAGAGVTGASHRTAVLRLYPGAFANQEALRALLRRELMHVADMLAPGFGYTPRWVGAATEMLPDALLRERYRVLWDTSVDGRLTRRGWAPPGVRATRLGEFAAAFPMLGRQTGVAFRRLFADRRPTHAELVQFAAEPARILEAGRVGRRRAPHPGERCPLCGCPTHAFEPDAGRLPREARAGIQESFPAWRPAHGLCRQCADLYRARLRLANPETSRSASPPSLPGP
jgi:hypothetical protein